MVRRVLIYRLGSLGDTVVALPCFHLIARAFPEAERRVLTNFPTSTKEAPVQAVLQDSGLVHGYMQYPLFERRPQALLAIRNQIALWRPEVLVYLTVRSSLLSTWRDVLFFKLCGIPRVIGAPLTPDCQNRRRLAENDEWEHEAARLARCLRRLGDAAIGEPQNWDLHLTENEDVEADRALAGWPRAARFLGVSVGAKVDVKDWGEKNWAVVLDPLGRAFPGLGLATIGAAAEAERSHKVAAAWPGPTINLCGQTSPRVSAAILKRAVLYLGHDGGPMHLAVAVGTPCVAVFSARSQPGVWFPYGAQHRTLYHRTPCFGCELNVCVEFDKKCIRAIQPQEVLAICLERLSSLIGAAERGAGANSIATIAVQPGGES